jgi:hypothetical protein
MPTNFPRDGQTGGFQSPLAMAIDTPQFAAYKASLRPYFESDEALKKTMADAVALTNYLRDYIWSIGVDRMRAPAVEGAPPFPLVPHQQQPRTPPATPGVQTGEREGEGTAPVQPAARRAAAVTGLHR